MQATHAAAFAGAGVIDLADMKRLAKRTEAAFAKQPGKVPALVLETFVLHAEQSVQRQRLQQKFTHSVPRYRFNCARLTARMSSPFCHAKCQSRVWVRHCCNDQRGCQPSN
ncbi:hypothetical protein D9M71_529180 [compost metagenome]